MPDIIEWKERVTSNYLEDWMLIVLLVSLVLIAIVQVKNNEAFSILAASIFVPKKMAKESANQLGWTDTEKTVLLAVYFLSFSLMTTLVLLHLFPYFASLTSSFAFFMVIVSLSVILFFLRIGVLALIQNIVGKYQFIQEYSFSIGQNNRILGMIYVPLCLLIILFPSAQVTNLIYFTLIIFAVIYLSRVGRLILNSLKFQGGLFYIILYLCAFEFLPFLIGFHFLKSIIKG